MMSPGPGRSGFSEAVIPCAGISETFQTSTQRPQVCSKRRMHSLALRACQCLIHDHEKPESAALSGRGQPDPPIEKPGGVNPPGFPS